MVDSVCMKLVFRIAEIGFALPVGDLVEIREGVGDWLDRSAADPDHCLVGTLPHRGEMIPVRDLQRGFCLAPGSPTAIGPVLILAGRGGPWGALVDRVEGIFSDAEFSVQPLPWLLTNQHFLPYGRVAVRNGEPLVLCEPDGLEACWGKP